jgi:H+/Cl- antiporter ClcA
MGAKEVLTLNSVILLFIWLFFTTITSGTAVPSGIFLPCIIIGCCMGNAYAPVHKMIFQEGSTCSSSMFAILGASAMLSGSTRMTYSLAVVILETTSNIELFLPIIFTLFISYGTGSLLINKSIYASLLRIKNIPILAKEIPRINRHIVASTMMTPHVKTLHFLPTV